MIISSTTTITFKLPEDEAAHQAFIKTMSDDWVFVGDIYGSVSYRKRKYFITMKEMIDDDK